MNDVVKYSTARSPNTELCIITLHEPGFEDVKYTYKDIEFVDDYGLMQYEVNVLSSSQHENLMDNVEFKSVTGKVLLSIVSKTLDNIQNSG